MKFLKIYGATLLLSVLFMFFGGWMLFDFRQRFWVATAACALIAAVIVFVFVAQDSKIERLEQRVKALEEKER